MKIRNALRISCQDHDYCDFAQEFLVRNEQYKGWFFNGALGITDLPPEDKEGLAERWGLSFPL